MYIMAGLLVIGFICNLFVKAVNSRFHMAPTILPTGKPPVLKPLPRGRKRSRQMQIDWHVEAPFSLRCSHARLPACGAKGCIPTKRRSASPR